MRRSPLEARHRASGAKLVPFAEWEMPLHYGSIVAEHRAVRATCGVFDLSHLGTLRVTGSGAETCVQRAFTNDVAALREGRAQYSLCLDEDGGIVDDLLVYHLAWGFLVVPNAANTAAVRAALDREGREVDAVIADVKDDLACIAVQGPRAAEMCAAAGVSVDGLTYLDCRPWGDDAEASDDAAPPPGAGVLGRSGYTGERGYEMFVPAAAATPLWDRLVAAGARPAGLGARDTLRLEMGYPLHGNDISRGTSPVEAGLTWAVKPGTGFHGEGAYLRAKEAGPARRLRGLEVIGRGIPRAHCEVRRDDVLVGETTSGTFSPTLAAGIALAYLDAAVALEDEVDVEVRGKHLQARVTRPPFVDADPKR